jgi:hypothetical protein
MKYKLYLYLYPLTKSISYKLAELEIDELFKMLGDAPLQSVSRVGLFRILSLPATCASDAGPVPDHESIVIGQRHNIGPEGFNSGVWKGAQTMERGYDTVLSWFSVLR